MDPSTPVQTQVTDFFQSTHSRKAYSSARKNAKHRSAGGTKLLSAESPMSGKNAKIEDAGLEELALQLSTPSKRKRSTGGANVQSESASKRTRSKATKKTASTTKSATRSKAMFSFGPRVGKVDFASTRTGATETVSNCQEQQIATSTITATASTTTIEKSEEQQSSTPTKAPLNIQEIKERLKNCKNLANLKQHLASINDCAEKVKQFKSMKVSLLSPVKSAYTKMSPRKVSSPEKFSLSGLTMIPSPLRAKPPSTPSKLLRSPYLTSCVDSPRSQVKLACSRKLFGEEEEESSDTKASDSNNNSKGADLNSENVPIPAYKRFAYLAKSGQPSEVEPQLPLPNSLKKIGEHFKRIDYFAWHYRKRQETLTFDKLKAKIEVATRRSFDLPMFVKVLTVLHREEKRWFQLNQEIIAGRSQLTISPLFEEHVRAMHSVNTLLEREKEFNKMLLEITKVEHLQFLASLKLTLTPQKTVYNWHPMFNLDAVADVVPDMSLLPKPQAPKCTGNANSILKYFAARQPANEAKEEQPQVAPKEEPADSTAKPKADRVESGPLKGISLQLLNKVREKEAATKARLMFRSPEADRELTTLSRAPAMVRIIERYFASTRARSHTITQIVLKLADSLKMTAVLAEQQLNYLLSLELRSDPVDTEKRWLRKATVSHVTYLIIEPECKIAFLLAQIQTRVDQLKHSD